MEQPPLTTTQPGGNGTPDSGAHTRQPLAWGGPAAGQIAAGARQAPAANSNQTVLVVLELFLKAALAAGSVAISASGPGQGQPAEVKWGTIGANPERRQLVFQLRPGETWEWTSSGGLAEVGATYFYAVT